MSNFFYYPDCPFCGNSTLSIVNVIIEDLQLKGIQCNNPTCSKYIGFFKDDTEIINTINEKIDDLESDLDSAENRIDDLERIIR